MIVYARLLIYVCWHFSITGLQYTDVNVHYTTHKYCNIIEFIWCHHLPNCDGKSKQCYVYVRSFYGGLGKWKRYFANASSMCWMRLNSSHINKHLPVRYLYTAYDILCARQWLKFSIRACDESALYVPYIGKLLREKTFTIWLSWIAQWDTSWNDNSAGFH